jgi:hypothetical protein
MLLSNKFLKMFSPVRITLYYYYLLSFGYFYFEHKMFSFVFDVFHVLSVTQESDFDLDNVGSFYVSPHLPHVEDVQLVSKTEASVIE